MNRAKKFRLESPTAAAAILNGRMSIGSGDTLAKLPPEIQASILAEATSGAKLKKRINEALREWRTANPVALPEGRFNVIVSDPAWPVDDVPYLTDRIDEIETDHRIWLAEKAADDCYLFLWTTSANLPVALKLIESLGWKYAFPMTWHKSSGHKHPNRPTYTGEYIIVATQGSPQFTDTRGFQTVFYATQGKHSEKPDEFYQMIKRATAGPRLELHARRPHDGFVPYGDEIDRSKQTGSPSLVPEPIRVDPLWISSTIKLRNEKIDLPSYSAFLKQFRRLHNQTTSNID